MVASRFSRYRVIVGWRRTRSSAPTRWPDAATAIAVWTAVVDLPVPPFSLAKTMKCGWFMLDLFPRGPETPPRQQITRGSRLVQTVRSSEELARARAQITGVLALV